MSNKRRPKQNKVEAKMANTLDQLAAFEDYCNDILPLLRQAIKDGWSREQIDSHPKIQAMLAARQISIALTELDSGKAMTAIKDHRDRSQGKPTERVETTHKYEKLKDEELDALLLSEMPEEDLDGLVN